MGHAGDEAAYALSYSAGCGTSSDDVAYLGSDVSVVEALAGD